jgi:hypothetical protein
LKKIKILILIFILFKLTGCGKPNYKQLEKDLVAKSLSYYESNIKDKVLNINNHKITIYDLGKSNIDIKEFNDAKCDPNSYVLIKLTLNREGKSFGDYKTEVYLRCGDYNSSK